MPASYSRRCITWPSEWLTCRSCRPTPLRLKGKAISSTISQHIPHASTIVTIIALIDHAMSFPMRYTRENTSASDREMDAAEGSLIRREHLCASVGDSH